MAKEESLYDDLIIKSAELYRIDANLIRAICAVESNWNTWANRFEPAATLEHDPRTWADHLNLSYLTEQHNQHSSWGLMQVMGFLARDLGFTLYIPMLCQPDIGLFYGSKYLKKLFERSDCPTESDIISAYNQGSPRKTVGGLYLNQKYVDSVYAHLNVLRHIN